VQHNSSSGYTLPPEFSVSSKVLLEKWPNRATIVTLCDWLRVDAKQFDGKRK
jgi:hypothetical protein